MIQRTNVDIAIHRASDNETGVVNVATVPITEKSVHKFLLMQEDYIQLDFSLPEAVHFAIGDSFSDELFGTFVLASEQMPKYNQNTGGYDYSLRFDKDYMTWKNWVHCLVANGQRMEGQWSLTDQLSTHAQQIADGVNLIIGAQTSTEQYINPETHETTIVSTNNGYAIDIDQTDTKASEVKFITYSGVDFITAMNMIAEEWECEWWVDNVNTVVGGVTYQHTIHFGKCELSNEAYEFRLGENVESMDIARDQQNYCNRIFAYGGTQNVPEDYDRELVFECTYLNGNSFKDENRGLTLDMIEGYGTVETKSFLFDGNVERTQDQNRYTYQQVTETQSLTGSQTIRGTINSSIVLEGIEDWASYNQPTVSAVVVIHAASDTQVTPTIRSGGSNSLYFEAEIDMESTFNNATNVYFEVVWYVTLNDNVGFDSVNVNVSTVSTVVAVASASAATKQLKLHIGANEYDVTFSGTTKLLSFVGNVPVGFVARTNSSPGTKYILTPLTYEVPLKYYTPIYNTGTLSKVGEKRIHLPLNDYPNRYYELEEQDDMGKAVESVVVFNDIFPKLNLKISDIGTSPKKEKITHSDGSVSYEDWTQYMFKVTKENGDPFLFKIAYMLDGAKLQVVFSPATSMSQSPHQLGGMAFDLDFDGIWYKIIRNEDYGAKIPNDLLKPSEDDALILTGWNPRAISGGLGLVADAENELATKSGEYLQAVHEGQFTFTCRMMSKWLFDLCARRFYVNNEEGDSNTNNDQPFFVNNLPDDVQVENDLAFYVSNGYTEYALLNVGAKVKVFHDALPGKFEDGVEVHYKESRVIGYEYKLDLPYDTPTYIIGETEAYSRLKKIEKELTKLS